MDSTEEQHILHTFGVPALRAGQKELIRTALAGRNTLGVLPTGHGKSLCYQAAALLLGGTSVVVSPLIALMRDQVQSLRRRGIAAARFDSTLQCSCLENPRDGGAWWPAVHGVAQDLTRLKQLSSSSSSS